MAGVKRRVRRVTALAAVTVLAGLAGGCSSSSSSGVPLGPVASLARTDLTSVVMVGDSITEGSAVVLDDSFTAAGFTDVVVAGKASRRIDVGNGNGSAPLSGIRTIYSLLAEGAAPDLWVIELGTNDVGAYATDEEYADLIDQVLDMLPADVPVVWVNTFRPDQPDHTVRFNRVLDERMRARGNTAVADWYAIAADPAQTVLQGDRLHPNDNGHVALAMLVIAAINRLP